MSKRESLSRYNLIIKKLKQHPASFKEISQYLELESEIQGYNFSIEIRTFQRDIKDILALYDIEIKYDRYLKAYKIERDEQPEVTARILEAYDIFNSLNISERLSNHIHFEKRKPQGTQNLYGLLHAIQKKVQILFVYDKFWNGELTNRIVEPLALKEFKQRWYLIAKDLKDATIKTFGLDRLSELEISKTTFQTDKEFDPNEHFKYCFGIVGPNDTAPEDIVLLFNRIQAKYIKSLPLHETQEIIEENEKGLLIKLKLFISLDLIMEVLSYGDSVEVLEPTDLREAVKGIYRNALLKYQ